MASTERSHLQAEYASSVLGYPRIGPRRELKRALESYWHGESSREDLIAVGKEIQENTWQELNGAGLTQIPGNTFSFYDHVLDTALLFGAIPTRFAHLRDAMNPLDLYFTLARGLPDLPPLELKKFLGTRYHYRQPEVEDTMEFSLHPEYVLEEVARAKADGVELRPVVLGPVSLLLMSKASPSAAEHFVPLTLLPRLLDQYEAFLEALAKAGVICVQLDEPYLTFDRTEDELEAVRVAYTRLGEAPLRPRVLVTGAYGDLGDALPILASTRIEAIGLDLVSAPKTAEELAAIPGMRRKRLYAGVVDGRNVWRTDKFTVLERLRELKAAIPDLVVSTSCSLMHLPYDVLSEYDLPDAVADELAFAKQRVAEVVSLARALVEGPTPRWRRPVIIPDTINRAVRERVAAVSAADRDRAPYRERRIVQEKRLGLPLVPASTLGSFPQKPEIRRARYDVGEGRIPLDEYYGYLREEIARLIERQEDIGLDVLVHGEVERNDMIQYFAELMDGFAVTRNGWVQSYGSRCTRPPILYGDVTRRVAPMTVEWISYAQSLTDRPVKGILTGPVTMLARSFVREDLPLREVADQIALAVRDEIADLEAAGIAIIQVDEPSIRELLPRRDADQKAYVDWAVDTFRLSTGGAKPDTQIHTHLNYSSISLMVKAIERLDADVTAIVATRSIQWVLDALEDTDLTREIAPGVYESRSARIPDIDELDARLTRAAESVGIERLWAVPDGGLKTRYYWQLDPSLRNMVAAARRLRRRHAEREAAASAEEDVIVTPARRKLGEA